MKLEKNKESGYLLIESLLVLSILLTLILLVYPLVVDWLVLKERKSNQVEQNRALYEASCAWIPNEKQIKTISSGKYQIIEEKKELKMIQSDKETGVEIYEVYFE